MQNHLQYPQSVAGQGPNSLPSHQKYISPNHTKGFDKTMPVPNPKHYASNPNLSLEFPHQKPPNGSNEGSTQSGTGLKKNLEYRAPPTSHQYPFNQNQHSRANRAEMTKSLIVPDTNNVDIPEEGPSSKKELFKNLPKRQYRMSQTIEDLPEGFVPPRRDTLPGLMNKEGNFYKKDSMDQSKEGVRQVPSFLNRDRGGDMKRSQVVQPTFQANRLQMPRDYHSRKPKGRKITVDDFIKVKQLGNGKYGRVYLVKQKYCGFICALKVIEKKLLHEEQITDQFIREVKIQMFLNHPNIIKLYGCFDDSTNIYIILEVGTGGQLYHQLKKSQPLSEPRIAFIMRQICDAVNEIHSLRIIHRDIKPQNIVLHDNIIKLCDFGWSVHQDNKLRTTFCGTPLYVCPEILKGKQYDEKIDIWSIGIMMYEMVVGQNPFKITKEEELIKIVKDQIKIPSYLFVSAQVRDFLDKCLQKNPGDRGNIKQLVNHPFFKKHAEKNDKSKMLSM